MIEKITFLIMRISLGVVFLLFGIGKFQNDVWAHTMRHMDFFLKIPLSVDISIVLIGASEIVIGACLITGVFRRFFAGLAAIELLGILVLLNFGEIRDIGLLGLALYLAVAKNDFFSLPSFWKKPARGG